MVRLGRPRHNPTFDNLLEMDGDVYVIREDGAYWVKFAVRRVAPSAARPHGIQYSLTMHGADNQRLVGFDNAHPLPVKGRERGGQQPCDHSHVLGRVKAYKYENAAKLLADCWEAVDKVLKIKGGRP